MASATQKTLAAATFLAAVTAATPGHTYCFGKAALTNGKTVKFSLKGKRNGSRGRADFTVGVGQGQYPSKGGFKNDCNKGAKNKINRDLKKAGSSVRVKSVSAVGGEWTPGGKSKAKYNFQNNTMYIMGGKKRKTSSRETRKLGGLQKSWKQRTTRVARPARQRTKINFGRWNKPCGC